MLNLDLSANQAVQSQECADGFKALSNGDYEAAVSSFKKAVEKQPEKKAYFGMGQAYHAQEEYIEAVKSLIEAVKLDQTYHEAFCLIGDIYFHLGQATPAIENYGQAVANNPTNPVYKQKFVNVVSALKFKKANPNLKGILYECMEGGDVELLHFGSSWLSIMSTNSPVTPFYKLAKHQKYDAFKKGMKAFPNLDGLTDSFFLIGLGQFIVPDNTFEQWCTHLRRYLLEAFSEGQWDALFSESREIELVTCLLSRYCFFTEYIFAETSEETEQLEKLKDKIEGSNEPDLLEVSLYGCYRQLALLTNARDIADKLQGGDHVSQIPKSQIEDYIKQQEIKKSIPALTKIDDAVSSAVQEQYEEFPYPRWSVAAKDSFDEEVEGHLKGKAAKILVAGCGTGKEAIQLAYAFPDAKITAVDLSLTSLAYAIYKAQELGIKNVEFKQADIMELGKIDDRFDYIASSGVLHHMGAPKAGWEILNGLLKPGGLIRIGLYSRQARWAINDARKVIEDKGIASDAQSIKGFRENISSHLKYKSIKNLEALFDYYSIPECRDLLFHVQEHQFDLREIKSILDEFELEFLKFYLPSHVVEKYKKRNPEDAHATNLESWANWEDKNPDTFIGMYIFWSRKPEA